MNRDDILFLICAIGGLVLHRGGDLLPAAGMLSAAIVMCCWPK